MLAALPLLVFQTNPAIAAGDIINGSSCVAANLAQAEELAWNQARVINPSDNPNDRFVVCNIATGPKIVETTSFTQANSGRVGTWFAEDADPSAEVSCAIREIGEDQTGNSGLDSVTVDISAPATLPGTAAGTFSSSNNIAASIVFIGTNNFRSITFTCRLAPGTGIQQAWVNQTAPAA